MHNVSEETLTDAVIATMAGTNDPRTRELLACLVKHLHAFIRETRLTEEEWLAAIRFLTATGQKCDDTRQEFIMLSDTLGASAMKDLVLQRGATGATEASLLGPFYREGAPELPSGADIAAGAVGESALVSGQVRTPDWKPLAGALLDVWQASGDGLYDVQDPSIPDMGLRGRFRTDAQGRYSFRTVKPCAYPVPVDGPVGDMLKATNRHPYRPGHIHFMLSAGGYRPLITELFVEGDPSLDSDPVFGVRDSLVVPFISNGAGEPVYQVEYDFVLQPA